MTALAPPDIPRVALDWHRQGRGVAVATLVSAWGAAPLRPGAQMVVDADGLFEGVLAGGCIEQAVATMARRAVDQTQQMLFEQPVSDADAMAAGLACGGPVQVLIEPVGAVLPVGLLERLVDARAEGTSVAYVTDIRKGQPRLLPGPTYAQRQKRDQSGLEEDGTTYVGIHNPPLRLIIVGAVQIAMYLAAMAQACDYQVWVIDPRNGMGQGDGFAGITLVQDRPDAALRAMAIDARTAIVTLSHDETLDDPAIVTALESPALYLGCLGSKTTQSARLARLREVGFGDDDLARLHGPAGLNIGASTPAEIALSILAQITQVLRDPQP